MATSNSYRRSLASPSVANIAKVGLSGTADTAIPSKPEQSASLPDKCQAAVPGVLRLEAHDSTHKLLDSSLVSLK